MIAKVDRLETEVQAMRKADGEQEAINCRYRILRFGDEVKHGTRHSQEHFEQILADIDAYEIYCKDHKDFKTTNQSDHGADPGRLPQVRGNGRFL